MPESFPSSFVRASAAEQLATTSASTTRIALPPWLRPLNGVDPLPPSLYPILPPPVPSVHFQPTTMSRSSSKTAIDHDTVMSDVYYHKGDRESSASTPEPIHSARPRFVKEKKAALRAADAIHKANMSKKRSIKTVKDKKKASASGIPNVPARHTRSTTRPRPDASTQIISSPEIDAAQLNEKKTLTRKTWLPEERATLEAALVSWWEAKGADKYNHPTKMVLPDKEKSNSDWEWILAECKAMDESFDRGRNGLMIMARKMNRYPLPPISDA